jgi:hypothetical protein
VSAGDGRRSLIADDERVAFRNNDLEIVPVDDPLLEHVFTEPVLDRQRLGLQGTSFSAVDRTGRGGGGAGRLGR